MRSLHGMAFTRHSSSFTEIRNRQGNSATSLKLLPKSCDIQDASWPRAVLGHKGAALCWPSQKMSTFNCHISNFGFACSRKDGVSLVSVAGDRVVGCWHADTNPARSAYRGGCPPCGAAPWPGAKVATQRTQHREHCFKPPPTPKIFQQKSSLRLQAQWGKDHALQSQVLARQFSMFF